MLKTGEDEDHKMSAKRKAASQKANEAKRLKRLETEALHASLIEREKTLKLEVAQVQTRLDTTFEDLVQLRIQNEELKVELEKRKLAEKKEEEKKNHQPLKKNSLRF